MKTYLTYAPIALILVWLYLAYRSYKTRRDFQDESGIKPFSLRGFRFFFNPNKNKIEQAAFDKAKYESSKSLKIWLISILIFFVVTIIVGIATAKRT